MAKSKYSYGKNRQLDKSVVELEYCFREGTTQHEITEIVKDVLQEVGLERYAMQDTPALAINIPATVWNHYCETSEPKRHILTVAVPECPNPHYSKDKSVPRVILWFKDYEIFKSISDEHKQKYSTFRNKIATKLEEKVRETREPPV